MTSTTDFSARIDRIAQTADARAFLITSDSSDRIRVHGMKGVATPTQGRALARRIEAETGQKTRYKSHSVAGLNRAESLESMLDGLKFGTVLHDPTALFARAKVLVAFAETIRDHAGGRVAGIFWSGEWRTLFIRLDPAAFVSGDKINLVRLGETEDQIRRAFAETCGEDGLDWVEAVRITFEGLPIAVTPVDALSEQPGSKLARRVSRGLAASVLGASLGFGAAAQAQDTKPAVSGVNGSLSVIGGGYEASDFGTSAGANNFLNADGSAGVALLSGTLTIPISHEFGAQFDVGAGLAKGDPIYGGTMHVFWRDPDVALAGLIASYARTERDVFVDVGGNAVRREDQIHIGRVGVEAEMYLDRFSILARGGFQFGSGEEDAFGRINLAYYPMDNLMVAAGPEYFPGVGIGADFSIEYADTFTDSIGISVFMDGAVHDSSNYHALVGIRLYFGDDKTLIRRHREDDPSPDDFVTGITNGSQATSYFYSGL